MSEPIFLDMASSATTIVSAPIGLVWSYLLEQATWMREFRIETVAGEHNKEGEVKKVMHLEPGSEDFFFKTLLLVPFRKFVYKAYTDSRAGRYGFTGIEVLSLGDIGKDTGIVFEAYLEIQSATMTKEELAQFVSEAREGSLAMWERNFQRLSSLILGARGH